MKDVTMTVMNIAGSIVTIEYHFFFSTFSMNAVAVHSTMVARVWFSHEK